MSTITILGIIGGLFVIGAHSLDVGTRRLLAPAPSPGSGTDAKCCAKLAAIKFTSNLPVVIVDSGSNNITRTARPASLCTCSQGLVKGDVNATVDFRLRGGTNSQLRNRLYKYKVEFTEKKRWFLGMPQNKKWDLYAQELDPFALHEWFGYQLSKGTGEYTIRNQFFELFIDDDGMPLSIDTHYRGIYLAEEPITQGKERVNITDNGNSTGVDEGYILEFSHSQNPKNIPTVNGTQSDKQWLVLYPKGVNITTEKVDFMQRYLNSFEKALYGPSFTDPAIGWRNFANETAFVDWFLTSELIKNAKHTYHSSAYMQKDSGKKLAMGPLWDNVQGFGTCCGYPVQGYNSSGVSAPNPASGGNAISSNGWLFSVCENDNCPVLDSYDPNYGIAVWFQQLWKDPSWIKACAARFSQLRAGPWSDASIKGQISALQNTLKDPAARTITRFRELLYQPGYYASTDAQVASTFQMLSDWTLARLKWMDSAFQQALQPALDEGPYPTSYASPSNVASAGK